MKTKTTTPNPELDQLLQEGEALLNGQLTVTFTKEDQEGAGPYQDIGNCILCRAFTRMGFKRVSAGGEFVRLDGELWFFDTEQEGNPAAFKYRTATGFNPSIIGKSLVFTKE